MVRYGLDFYRGFDATMGVYGASAPIGICGQG